MSAQVTSVFTARDSMTRTLGNIERSSRSLERSLGTLGGKIRTALTFNVVNRGMNLFERGIYRLIHAFPDLIGRGQQWAEVVDDISDATGVSAERASTLAAINQRVGGTSDALVIGLKAMAKSIYGNGDAWKEMGVHIARANDGSVDAWATFQNLRRAISATGGSLLSTNAAQVALGRGGKNLLDLLQLTDRQWRLLEGDARRSGQVMTDAASSAAEAWGRAQARFGATIDGLGAKILGGLAPLLTKFADGFTDFIQRNMDNIVRLVVGGANTILTVLADLLGIDMTKWSFTEQLGKLASDAPKASRGLRDMGDAHRKAASAAKDHGDQQRRLRDELGKAYHELYRIQQQSTFRGNMSGVEKELWRQRKLAQIADAEERVSQAKKALGDHRRTMATMTAVTAKAADRMKLDMGGVFKGGRNTGGGKTGGGGIFGDIGSVLDESTAAGHQIAADLKAGFGNIVSALGTVGGHLSNLSNLLGGNGPLVLGILALAKILPGIPGVGLLRSGIGAGASSGIVVNPVAIAAAAALAVNVVLDKILPPESARSRSLSGQADSGLLGDLSPTKIMGRLTEAVSAIIAGGIRNNPAGYSVGGARGMSGPPGSGAFGSNHRRGTAAGIGRMDIDWDKIPSMPGFGMASEPLLRRYLGESSPMQLGNEDTLRALSSLFGVAQATATNTTPLGSGTLGVLATIQNAMLTIAGNVGANITNPSLPVTGSGVGGRFPVTGNVGASITNTVPVTGTGTGGNVGVAVSGSVGVTNGNFGGIGSVSRWSAGSLPVNGTGVGGSLPIVGTGTGGNVGIAGAVGIDGIPTVRGTGTGGNLPIAGAIGVSQWTAGAIGTEGRGTFRVDNAPGTYMGIWPSGGKALPVNDSDGPKDGVVRDQLTVQKNIAMHTQSTAARLGSGGDIVYWLKILHNDMKGGASAPAMTSSLRASA